MLPQDFSEKNSFGKRNKRSIWAKECNHQEARFRFFPNLYYVQSVALVFNQRSIFSSLALFLLFVYSLFLHLFLLYSLSPQDCCRFGVSFICPRNIFYLYNIALMFSPFLNGNISVKFNLFHEKFTFSAASIMIYCTTIVFLLRLSHSHLNSFLYLRVFSISLQVAFWIQFFSLILYSWGVVLNQVVIVRQIQWSFPKKFLQDWNNIS